MQTFTRVWAAVLVAVAALNAEQPRDTDAAREFARRLSAYVDLRSKAGRDIVRAVSPDPGVIVDTQRRLAAAIRAARPSARGGDIFTKAICTAFRERIERALVENHSHPARLLAELTEDSPDIPPALTVNGEFDWRFGAQMPPFILAVLPQLPEGLQYRLVTRDLVLIDVDADLIVDVLRDALPSGRMA